MENLLKKNVLKSNLLHPVLYAINYHRVLAEMNLITLLKFTEINGMGYQKMTFFQSEILCFILKELGILNFCKK